MSCCLLCDTLKSSRSRFTPLSTPCHQSDCLLGPGPGACSLPWELLLRGWPSPSWALQGAFPAPMPSLGPSLPRSLCTSVPRQGLARSRRAECLLSDRRCQSGPGLGPQRWGCPQLLDLCQPISSSSAEPIGSPFRIHQNLTEHTRSAALSCFRPPSPLAWWQQQPPHWASNLHPALTVHSVRTYSGVCLPAPNLQRLL